jgi:hypothetical protein
MWKLRQQECSESEQNHEAAGWLRLPAGASTLSPAATAAAAWEPLASAELVAAEPVMRLMQKPVAVDVQCQGKAEAAVIERSVGDCGQPPLALKATMTGARLSNLAIYTRVQDASFQAAATGSGLSQADLVMEPRGQNNPDQSPAQAGPLPTAAYSVAVTFGFDENDDCDSAGSNRGNPHLGSPSEQWAPADSGLVQTLHIRLHGVAGSSSSHALQMPGGFQRCALFWQSVGSHHTTPHHTTPHHTTPHHTTPHHTTPHHTNTCSHAVITFRQLLAFS